MGTKPVEEGRLGERGIVSTFYFSVDNIAKVGVGDTERTCCGDERVGEKHLLYVFGMYVLTTTDHHSVGTATMEKVTFSIQIGRASCRERV